MYLAYGFGLGVRVAVDAVAEVQLWLLVARLHVRVELPARHVCDAVGLGDGFRGLFRLDLLRFHETQD